ncbi:MAG: hypothetical protein GX638_03740 [Crenarchaeota archaeon]|nr:hypothetical protein [Thermoproteota archaeon]
MTDKNTLKYYILQELGREERPDFDNSDESDVKIINEKYEYYMGLALQVYPWSFTKVQTTAGEYTELTDSKYKYQYSIPEDCLYVNGRYDNNGYQYQILDYEQHDGYIYTNTTSLYLDYIRKQCESDMPTYFIDFAKYFIARNLCHVITGDINLLQGLTSAEQQSFALAKSIDFKQRKQRNFPTNVFISDRS